MERIWLALGALLIAAAVGWDAYRAHGLEQTLLAGRPLAEPTPAAPSDEAVPTLTGPAEASPVDAAATDVPTPAGGATPDGGADAAVAESVAVDAEPPGAPDPRVPVDLPAGWMTRPTDAQDLTARLQRAGLAGTHAIYQGLGLLALGLVLSCRRNVLIHLVAVAVVAGIGLFAGGLAVNTFRPNAVPDWVIPSGGSTLIIAWAVAAVFLLFSSRREADVKARPVEA